MGVCQDAKLKIPCSPNVIIFLLFLQAGKNVESSGVAQSIYVNASRGGVKQPACILNDVPCWQAPHQWSGGSQSVEGFYQWIHRANWRFPLRTRFWHDVTPRLTHALPDRQQNVNILTWVLKALMRPPPQNPRASELWFRVRKDPRSDSWITFGNLIKAFFSLNEWLWRWLNCWFWIQWMEYRHYLGEQLRLGCSSAQLQARGGNPWIKTLRKLNTLCCQLVWKPISSAAFSFIRM